jgi:hypothetical protein
VVRGTERLHASVQLTEALSTFPRFRASVKKGGGLRPDSVKDSLGSCERFSNRREDLVQRQRFGKDPFPPNALAMIVERVKAQGKRLGRPRIDSKREAEVKALRGKGKGTLKIAKEVGLGVGTVKRIIDGKVAA